jgi:hypothetical protein
MIEIVIADTVGTLTLTTLEVPLTEQTIENATDVQTLDYNVYTDFINTKRQWVHRWDSLTQTQYNSLRAFYNRQFTLYQYPTLTIDYYSVSDVPVRMYLNEKDIVDNCGTIENVEVRFRETALMPEVGSS